VALIDPGRLLIKNEYAEAALGHASRNDRLEKIVEGLVDDPSASFPDAAGGDSALEGTYRFLNNPAVRFEQIWGPHRRCTRERAAASGQVLVVHDTSVFSFVGDREGLGPVTNKVGSKGFYGHFALALADETTRDPLGVLGFKSYVRGLEKKEKRGQREQLIDPGRETLRWWQLVHETEQLLVGHARAVHVMDREADSYELFAKLLENKYQFVIRVRGDRATTTPLEGSRGHVHVTAALAPIEHCVEREVPLSRRKQSLPKAERINPSRSQRVAVLRMSCHRVELLRPSYLPSSMPQQLALNVVRVHEAQTPSGEPPVEWMLVTNLPVESAKDVERVVDIYRARWTIEEFFKALKSGCAFEKRQLESLHALLNALAIFLPIAWRLLRLRTLSREQPSASANTILSPTQLAVLKSHKRLKLPPAPSAAEALLAIAALGGHLKNNGAPGWHTLGKGFEKLLLMEVGWIAATAERFDQ
jgi:Transposase DNA-binding/Transposase DDE domain